MNRKLYTIAIAAVILLAGCTIKYSLSGASIPVAAQTVSIAYFPNNAPLVAPMLSATLTEGLQDRFSQQTRLELIREGGDLAFEGEIIGYTTAPANISSDEVATRNRLTITVKVRFTSILEPQNNYDRTFSQFLDYDTSRSFSEVESSLIPEIVDMLVDDIFNAAVANW